MEIVFESEKKRGFLTKFYEMFLLIFREESDNIPFRIIILKGLDVLADEQAYTVTLKHSSPHYHNVTLFLEEKSFSFILQYINNYSKDNFFKKYMIVEKIGRGRYSEIHKVLSYNKGETFAMKVITKEGLSE